MKKILACLVAAVIIAATAFSFIKPEGGVSYSPGSIVAVGGSQISDDIRRQFISLSGVKEPNLLIIPQATRKDNWENRGRQQAEVFSKLGVKNINVLSLDDPAKARELIRKSHIIWMPGGSQQRMINALDNAGVTQDIQARYLEGGTVGGTSAGAAILSDVMIANSTRDEETGALKPVISNGLGLWPEVIIDQHFSERNRLERLEMAIARHPDLTGIGIDESTALVFNGNSFEVMGEGTITVVRISETTPQLELDRVILHSGDSYKLKVSAKTEK